MADAAPPSEDKDASVEKKEDKDSEPEDSGFMSLLQKLFAKQLRLDKTEDGEVESLLTEVSLSGIAEYMKSDKCKNVIAMVGAGISTSAGIPDFRSPGIGLYSNLEKYNLPAPDSMFEINFFKENPEPFYHLAKELFPGKFKPTPCHYFFQLLHEKGYLLRMYTQNIDTLERIAGVPGEKLVEAHGTFFTSHCINRTCKKAFSLEWMKEKIFKDEIPRCDLCKTLIKPDIIFFGEQLPLRFFSCAKEDFRKCDLLIIVGTSLTVQPFAGLIDDVKPSTPRLLINKEKCGQCSQLTRMMGFTGGMDFDSESNKRDVAWLGLCDDGCKELANALGWGDELDNLVRSEHAKIDGESKNSI